MYMSTPVIIFVILFTVTITIACAWYCIRLYSMSTASREHERRVAMTQTISLETTERPRVYESVSGTIRNNQEV